MAKRRSNAITVTHLIPPLASAGLYKGLVDLKDSLTRWRSMDVADEAQAELETLIRDQAGAVDLKADDISKLWLVVLETEGSLIPDGLHIVGKPMGDVARAGRPWAL